MGSFFYSRCRPLSRKSSIIRTLPVIATALMIQTTLFGAFSGLSWLPSAAEASSIEGVEAIGKGDIDCGAGGGGIAPGQDVVFSGTKDNGDVSGFFSTSPSTVRGDITKVSVSSKSFHLSGILTEVSACGAQQLVAFAIRGDCEDDTATFKSRSGITISFTSGEISCSKLQT